MKVTKSKRIKKLLLLTFLIISFTDLAKLHIKLNAQTSGYNPDHEYVGSRHSRVFHKETCHFVNAIFPENLVSWPTCNEAKNAGRVACKVCKPCPNESNRPDGYLTIICLLILIAIAIVSFIKSEFTVLQYYVLRILLSISSSCVAVKLPGFIDVELSLGVRATGALAIFVIVFVFAPLPPRNRIEDPDRDIKKILWEYILKPILEKISRKERVKKKKPIRR